MKKAVVALVLAGLVAGACVVHAEEPPVSVLGRDVENERFGSPKHLPTFWDASHFYCREFGILVNTARRATTDADYAGSFPVHSETTLTSGYSMHSALTWIGTELAEDEQWAMAHAVAELTAIAQPSNADEGNFQTGIIHGRRLERLCGFSYLSPYSPDALPEYICGGTVSATRNRVNPPSNCQ